ncbi:MAG: hypothetical protein V1709_00890 [Planctomycetota bacterium]
MINKEAWENAKLIFGKNELDRQLEHDVIKASAEKIDKEATTWTEAKPEKPLTIEELREAYQQVEEQSQIISQGLIEFNKNLRAYYADGKKSLGAVLFSYGKIIIDVHYLRDLGIDLRIVESKDKPDEIDEIR